jgi:hypothetical protein
MSNILDDKLNVNIELANGGFDYFGFLHKNGSWAIMKSTTSTAAATTYAIGASGYSTAWTNRTSLVYTLPLISGS